jgi:hypothetical protein
MEQIVKIFQCATELRDFNINNLKLQGDYLFNSDETTDFQGCSAIHLKRFRIKTSNRRFQIIENLLQHTPNLKVFTLIANRAKEMLDADRWENLIHHSLIHLTDFQFQFSFLQVAFPDTKTNILSKFERFQGDFWKKEHQWLVRCVCSASSFMIHTIPYPSNNYILSLSTEHYSSELMNPKSVFDRVTDISVLYEMMETPCLSYFSNVKILRLTNDSTSQGFEPQYTLDCKHVESLKSFICLSNVTDLLIDRNYSLKSSSVMINLLNEASNISSLTIDLKMFRLLRVDDQVCSIFKRMIKSLFLLNDGYNALFSKVYSFEQFYHTFSDLEELECDLDDPSDFITFIQSLSNLSRISVCFTRWYTSQFEYSWYRQYFNIIIKDFYCIGEDVVPEQHGRAKRFVMSFRRRFR